MYPLWLIQCTSDTVATLGEPSLVIISKRSVRTEFDKRMITFCAGTTLNVAGIISEVRYIIFRAILCHSLENRKDASV